MDKKEKITIKLTSYDCGMLDEYSKKLAQGIKTSGGSIRGPVPLPNKYTNIVLNRSTKIYANSKEKFAQIIHIRLIQASIGNETVDYLAKVTLPAGIEAQIKHETL